MDRGPLKALCSRNSRLRHRTVSDWPQRTQRISPVRCRAQVQPETELPRSTPFVLEVEKWYDAGVVPRVSITRLRAMLTTLGFCIVLGSSDRSTPQSTSGPGRFVSIV